METQLPDPDAADSVASMPVFSAHDGTGLAAAMCPRGTRGTA